MICPRCKHRESQVVDSRDTSDGIRRRRECHSCKFRFTTYERVDTPNLIVIKKSGDKERFKPEKVHAGISTSCKNRPVTEVQIDCMVEQVEQQLLALGRDEVTSAEVGEAVRAALKEVDEIAYIRFVSVYEAFENPEQFTRTINSL